MANISGLLSPEATYRTQDQDRYKDWDSQVKRYYTPEEFKDIEAFTEGKREELKKTPEYQQAINEYNKLGEQGEIPGYLGTADSYAMKSVYNKIAEARDAYRYEKYGAEVGDKPTVPKSFFEKYSPILLTLGGALAAYGMPALSGLSGAAEGGEAAALAGWEGAAGGMDAYTASLAAQQGGGLLGPNMLAGTTGGVTASGGAGAAGAGTSAAAAAASTAGSATDDLVKTGIENGTDSFDWTSFLPSDWGDIMDSLRAIGGLSGLLNSPQQRGASFGGGSVPQGYQGGNTALANLYKANQIQRPQGLLFGGGGGRILA